MNFSSDIKTSCCFKPRAASLVSVWTNTRGFFSQQHVSAKPPISSNWIFVLSRLNSPVTTPCSRSGRVHAPEPPGEEKHLGWDENTWFRTIWSRLEMSWSLQLQKCRNADQNSDRRFFSLVVLDASLLQTFKCRVDSEGGSGSEPRGWNHLSWPL